MCFPKLKDNERTVTTKTKEPAKQVDIHELVSAGWETAFQQIFGDLLNFGLCDCQW